MYEDLQKLIDNSNNIVFFGGAGVSTASGIPDFRSDDGLYKKENKWKYRPETMLSISFFNSHKADFFEFYKEVMCVTGYKPNITHYKLAELEKSGKLKAVITQNVDGLHQLAGSENVIELHGSIHRNYCMDCGKEFSAEYIKNYDGIPRCDKCGGIVKPDVTLYGENLPYEAMPAAKRYIRDADLVIIAGTSLTVYPAAGLIDGLYIKNLVLINRDATAMDYKASLVIRDDMTKVFEQIKIQA